MGEATSSESQRGSEVAVKPAATVVLLREHPAQGMQVLLLRRQSQLAFAAGMWVFPGGRIDPEDHAVADWAPGGIGGQPDPMLAAARRAAAREALEEAAVRVDAEQLVLFAHWTTPADEGNRRRFATWFFAAALEGQQDVRVDGGEIEDHQWLRPADAIAAHRRREMAMLPPTYVALAELAACDGITAALAMYRQRKVMEIRPRVLARGDNFLALYPGDAGYESGDPDAEGARHRSWMTPDGWHYQRDD